jgi:hypothetical protein
MHQVIRVWAVVTQHDNVDKEIRRIEACHRRGQQSVLGPRRLKVRRSRRPPLAHLPQHA